MTALQKLSLVKGGYCHDVRSDKPWQTIMCDAIDSVRY